MTTTLYALTATRLGNGHSKFAFCFLRIEYVSRIAQFFTRHSYLYAEFTSINLIELRTVKV